MIRSINTNRRKRKRTEIMNDIGSGNEVAIVEAKVKAQREERRRRGVDMKAAIKARIGIEIEMNIGS